LLPPAKCSQGNLWSLRAPPLFLFLSHPSFGLQMVNMAILPRLYFSVGRDSALDAR
jgi:hypothetical protein